MTTQIFQQREGEKGNLLHDTVNMWLSVGVEDQFDKPDKLMQWVLSHVDA